MSMQAVNLVYILSAALFIFGLKQLGSPATAVRGNMLSAIGMTIAILVTLFSSEISDYKWILLGCIIGGGVGAYVARTVEMTSMPEMVALFNGSGGIASLLVGWAALYNATGSVDGFTHFRILRLPDLSLGGHVVLVGLRITQAAGKFVAHLLQLFQAGFGLADFGFEVLNRRLTDPLL